MKIISDFFLNFFDCDLFLAICKDELGKFLLTFRNDEKRFEEAAEKVQ